MISFFNIKNWTLPRHNKKIRLIGKHLKNFEKHLRNLQNFKQINIRKEIFKVYKLKFWYIFPVFWIQYKFTVTDTFSKSKI